MGTVNVLRSLNYDDKAIADIIQAEYQLTKEEAESYMAEKDEGSEPDEQAKSSL